MNRPELYTLKQIGNISGQDILALLGDQKKNMKIFKIRARSIPTFDKILTDVLDHDMFQDLLVHGIQYPVQKWTKEFDQQREKGGKYHLNFYE